MSAEQSIGTFHASKMVPRSKANSSKDSAGKARNGKTLNHAAARARDAVTGALQSMRDKVPTDLDWRKSVRQYPLASSLGALGVGALLGYALGLPSKKKPHARSTDVQAGRPGMVNRFKQTGAFDKIQREVAVIGDRLVNELSSLANDVAVPAISGKLSGLFEPKATSDSKPAVK